MLSPRNQIAYCTNVHAGITLPAIQQNLTQYSLRVRDSLIASGHWTKNESLGLGLWFSDSASHEVLQDQNLRCLRDWLDSEGLVAFTMNGFPQGDFHQKVVKHNVYLPPWWETSRKEYTLRLVKILDELLPSGYTGSISTLPIAWSSPSPTHAQWSQAAANLLHVARALSDLEERTGRQIVLAIEPEPGCALTDSASLRAFFEKWLLMGEHRVLAARYLTCCHDICHAGVMFENQRMELELAHELGIRIGKVQVSSAIDIDWETVPMDRRHQYLESLRSFAEDRYLHQTMIQSMGTQRNLQEDLPEILARVKNVDELCGQWRIHFHVPIFYDQVGYFGTTRHEIAECLRAIKPYRNSADQSDFFTGHFEVETYAWTVLPAEMRNRGLAEDIADELRYFRGLHDEVFRDSATS